MLTRCRVWGVGGVRVLGFRVGIPKGGWGTPAQKSEAKAPGFFLKPALETPRHVSFRF